MSMLVAFCFGFFVSVAVVGLLLALFAPSELGV